MTRINNSSLVKIVIEHLMCMRVLLRPIEFLRFRCSIQILLMETVHSFIVASFVVGYPTVYCGLNIRKLWINDFELHLNYTLNHGKFEIKLCKMGETEKYACVFIWMEQISRTCYLKHYFTAQLRHHQTRIVHRERMWAYGCGFPALSLDIYSCAGEE